MKDIFLTIWRKVHSRVWFIVTCVILVLSIVIGSVASTALYPLVNSVLPGERPVYAEDDGSGAGFELDAGYETANKSIETANAVNERVVDEGMVLLKNNDALPLKAGSKISVFGKNSVDIAYGGTGSGGGKTEGAPTVKDSLEDAGFSVNTTLWNFYTNNGASGNGRSENPAIENGGVNHLETGETAQSRYTDAVKASYNNFKDAALIVFTRISGEGWDLPKDYLTLDQNEQDLVTAVCGAGFEHVIVLLNAANPIEAGFIKDNDKIDGALIIGLPGFSGINSLGKILKGDVNPSGHTVDTYDRDHSVTPANANFGNHGVDNGNRYTVDGANQDYYYVDYEEGIYVGYRYYETRGLNDEEWYNSQVAYPFGFGLSYSTFEYEIVDKSSITSTLTKDKFSVTVKVSNTDNVAGKAVVQIYAAAPYTPGEIEKSAKVLVGFAKTEEIRAKSDSTVTIEIDPYYLASYDHKDLNKNDNKGYELDDGTYTFYVSTDAHTSIDTFTKTLDSDIIYDKDPVTGTDVDNLYTDNAEAKFNSDYMLESVLSRNDWEGTAPTTPTAEDKAVTAELISILRDRTENNPNTYTTGITTGENLPVIGTETDEDGKEVDVYLQLKNLYGVEYDDSNGNDYWNKLLNAVTVDEMNSLVLEGAFRSAAIEKIGKALTIDSDGPVGWTNFMIQGFRFGCAYASETLIGQTWSEELAKAVGVSVGNEGLFGNGTQSYTGWYAPGANIHRSQFGGRNFEYFSEDPFLTGKMAAAEAGGAKSKGIVTYMKHFAVNEQETNRDTNGLVTWLNEQSLREIYLKQFEIAVKESGTLGIMSSFNRVGAVWAGGDYRLLTTILRNEWGFKGSVICDFNMQSYMDLKQMAYAGGDLNLANTPLRMRVWAKADSNDDMNVLRNCTKNILYAYANSNAVNRDVIGYLMPVWQMVMIIVICVLIAGCGVWGVFAVRGALKPKAKTTVTTNDGKKDE